MLRSRLAGALALGVLVMTVPLACSDPFIFIGAGDGGGGDGPNGLDGSSADQTTDGNPGDGPGPGADGSDGPIDSPPEAPPAGHVVYVSTTGSDSNDGTVSTLPMKTIASALKRVATIALPAEVHVCTGVYAETSLTLALPIGLRGAYSCTTWTQTATYGYPTFDKTDLTVIANAAPGPGALGTTLLVTGGATTGALVDGFTIAGATTSTSPTVGVETTGATAVSVQNDAIGGGGGTASAGATGSIGVLVSGGSPVITGCAISGGSGTGSYGSVGMSIGGTGSPNVYNDTVIGGTGVMATGVTTGLAAVGIEVTTSLIQPNALNQLLVDGADPTATAVSGSTVGILVSAPGGSTASGLAVDILGSVVIGGIGSAPGTYSAAIDIDNPDGTVRIVGDRIVGGQRTSAPSQTIGIYGVSAGKLTVENSEIHAGEVLAGATSLAYGARIEAATSPYFVDDTIYAGPANGYALFFDTNATGVTITDDLLVGNGTADAEPAISASACTGQLTTADHTAFVGFPTLYACAAGTTSATTISQLGMELTAMLTTDDVAIGSSTGCDGGPCTASLFGASWSSDDGITGLLKGAPTGTDAAAMFQGWTLAPDAPCSLARGGTPYGGITTDLFGQTRSTTQPTMGAYEYTSTNCAP